MMESEFKKYLEDVAISQRTGGPLSRTAVGSYLIFIKNEKLFDYNPDKWRNTPSIYDIADLNKINEIIDTLSSDKGFVERDKNDNQGFRSRAIKQYRDFLKYRQGLVPPRTKQNGLNVIVQTLQKIFFGAPGTGKSFMVNAILGENRKRCFSKSDHPKSNGYTNDLCDVDNVGFEVWSIDNVDFLEKKLVSFESDNNVTNPRHSALRAYIEFLKKYKDEHRENRTTFHPDYDYAQFVGAYKPKKELAGITYSFVPQVFAKAYAAAWKQYFAAGNVSTVDNQVYLVIEEINRGNCAQIFGDIFQLLDRVSDGSDKGFSQYSIDADCDFADWLGKNGIGEGKLRLPPNLNILATMNTSDQSLFPMDSAFKRRFDWEYVPINYKMPKADFKVGKGDLSFNWLHFLKKVNADIRSVTESEDKQMGEFFIKPKDNGPITLEEFRSKVLFYLWDTVYKDETDKKNLFHFPYPEKGPGITFQRLFEEDEAGKLSDNSKKIIRKMLETLDAAYDSEEYNDFKIFPVKTEPTEDK